MVGFHYVAEYTAIRRKPNLYKYTIQLNQTFFFRFAIFDAQGSQFITISYHFRSLWTYKHFHVRQWFKSILKYTVCFQLIHKFKNSDFGADTS